MNGNSPINAEVWQELLELEASTEPGMLNEMITTYLNETGKALQLFPVFAKEKNEKALRSTAHKLKSSSASMGALILSQLLVELEKSDGLSQETINKLLARTAEEYERVRVYFEAQVRTRAAA